MAVGEALAEAVPVWRLVAVRQDDAVVLIGLGQILATALAAHDDQAGVLGQALRRQGVEQLGGDPAVQVGRELGDEADLGAGVVELADQEGRSARWPRPAPPASAARSIRAPIGSAWLAMRGQHVGGIEHADDLAVAAHHEVAHALRAPSAGPPRTGSCPRPIAMHAPVRPGRAPASPAAGAAPRPPG